MPKEWTDEEVQAEIASAIQIVREDRLETFLRTRFTSTNNSDNPPNTPPSSGGNDSGTNKKKKSLFWGVEE